MNYLAHSANEAGEEQSLAGHLEAVSALASAFVQPWGPADLARTAGLLHDLGKVREQFQSYVRGEGARGGDHATWGALWVPTDSASALLSLAIAGHHGGLLDGSDLKARLSKVRGSGECEDVLRRAQDVLSALPGFGAVSWPAHAAHDALQSELLVRMLFSALVDADFLDTERHFSPARAQARAEWLDLPTLWERFEAQHRRLANGAAPTPLNRLRAAVYGQCLEAAERPRGAFSLTVPTGGGKTLSAMGFALRHALKWGMGRVIVVIPYTSIIEQTAEVYRGALGSGAVLEHHSSADWRSPEDHEDSCDRAELASENWDAPAVVTTAVQFFESLFSNRPSRCRKLHRIANSVVLIDEAQTIPTHVLAPTFRLLRSLIEHYGVSLLLSTATQLPAETLLGSGLQVAEIVADPPGLFRQLRRVHYNVEGGESLPVMDWEQVAERMAEAPQAMAVLNTRRDARQLHERLPKASRVHLSTNLCGAHRREVLNRVRARLTADQPCHLATTQLVEAGVDLDFQLVLRAIGPLDRIAQAAGRCNREGRLDAGEVVVFEPREGGMPRGAYRTGADRAREMLEGAADLHDPATYPRYFDRLWVAAELDRDSILDDQRNLRFEQVARKYRIIEDDSAPVLVPWREGAELLAEVERRRDRLTRDDLRRLQPYFVNLHRRQFEEAQHRGQCFEIAPGLWRWVEGGYDDGIGLVVEADDLPFLAV